MNRFSKDLRECPKCKGDYVKEKITAPPYPIPVCKHCKEGKIEVIPIKENNDTHTL